MMMDEIKGDLAALNIKHDVFFSERSLIEAGNNQVAETIDFLRAKGDVYEGRLPPPKGAPVEDYEDREQTLFRATAYGDDVDRPLMKSDGSYTYFASDIAYHKNKFDRGFRNLIDVFGADHGGYIKRMQAAVKAVTAGKATLDVKIVQLVRLLRNGEPVKMSKRSGDFVTLREVVDEVGSRRGAVHDAVPQERRGAGFRPRQGDRAVQGQSGVLRPVRPRPRPFGVPQCPRSGSGPAGGGRRAGGVPRRGGGGAADRSRGTGPAAAAGALPADRRGGGGRHMSRTESLFICMILPANFTRLWTKGRDLPYLRFIINNDAEITKARLALVQGVVSVLASGLAVLGVHAPDEMR